MKKRMLSNIKVLHAPSIPEKEIKTEAPTSIVSKKRNALLKKTEVPDE